MTQETLEEAAEWLNKKFNGKGVEVKIIDWGKNEMYNYTPTKLLEEYSKWQQERMYSEEEVIKLLTERCKHFGTSLSPFDKLLLKQDLEWFEQVKKK